MMLKWDNNLLDFAEKLKQAADIECAMSTLIGCIGQFGGTDAGYAFSWHGGLDADDLLIQFDYPQHFLDQYDQAGHVAHDWSVIHCQREPREFYVSTDRSVLGRLTPRQLAVEHDAYDVGMRHVITMPLRGFGCGWGGLSVAFRGTSEAEFHRTLAAHEESLRRIGLLFHGAMRQKPGLGMVEISAREREILSWAANGYSSKAIAHRLNLSSRTVEHHIANACIRLGAHNRTHAVAKALVLNLIQP